MNKYLLFFLLAINIGNASQDDFPEQLTRMGLSHPTYDPNNRDIYSDHPVFGYKLGDESVAQMEVHYGIAMEAKARGLHELAFKILWTLAESGYAPANNDVAEALLEPNLGVDKNLALARIFVNRPSTIAEMRKLQASYCWYRDHGRVISVLHDISNKVTDASLGDIDLIDISSHSDENLSLLSLINLKKRIFKVK